MAGLIPFTGLNTKGVSTLIGLDSKTEPGIYVIQDSAEGLYGLVLAYKVQAYCSVQIMITSAGIKYRRSGWGSPDSLSGIDWIKIS